MAPATRHRAWLQSWVQLCRCSHCKHNLAGIKLRPLRHSQRLLSPSDFQRNWKADQYGTCGQLCWQNGHFWLAQKLPATWAKWTAESTAVLKQLAPFQQVESARDSTRDTATISPVSVTVQPADSAPQPRGKNTIFQPFKSSSSRGVPTIPDRPGK